MERHTLEKLEYGKIKENLKNHAATALGIEKAEELKPLKDPEKIDQFLLETAEGEELLGLVGPVPFGGIQDIRTSLKRGEKGFVLEVAEISQVSRTLYGFGQIKKYFTRYREEGFSYPAVESYAGKISDFSPLEKRLAGVLDEQGNIRDDASPRLKTLRREKKVIEQRIRDKMDSYLQSSQLEKVIREPVITIRGDRFVLPVRADKKSSLPGIIHDRSASGQTVFIEPQAVVEMNNKLREIERQEEEEIYRILKELTAEIMGKAEEIKVALEAAAQLDLIMAKAYQAREFDCSRPKLNSAGPVKFIAARHPLLSKEEVVPIDISLGDSFNTLVITGPNTGGKTVSLKTLGLLCLMAQSGLMIPADKGSEVGVFSGIYADIGDEQSIEQSLSTFSSHLTQIVRILEKAGPGDLVLLDEVGAGTDPEEGAGLAMALLQHLHEKGILTVATTHYTELKAFAYTEEGIENAAVEFDVETLSPTYRLLVGVPGRSNAFAIAARLGLSESIIEKAQSFVGENKSNVEGMISRIEKEEYALLEQREELKKEKENLEQELKELKEEKVRAMKQQESVMQEFSQKARAVLDEIKNEGDKLLKGIRKYAGPQGDRMANEFNLAMKKQEEKISALLTREEEKKGQPRPPADVKRGDRVKIISLGQEGSVLEEKGDRVNVQAGIMQVWVDKRDVVPSEGEETPALREQQKYQKSKSHSIKQNIDLRGKRWEEAREITDKYLDDAYLSGLGKIEIIHGKGTGALRQGIHSLLEGHPHVLDFRLGEAGEGGDGVTIVELKN